MPRWVLLFYFLLSTFSFPLSAFHCLLSFNFQLGLDNSTWDRLCLYNKDDWTLWSHWPAVFLFACDWRMDQKLRCSTSVSRNPLLSTFGWITFSWGSLPKVFVGRLVVCKPDHVTIGHFCSFLWPMRGMECVTSTNKRPGSGQCLHFTRAPPWLSLLMLDSGDGDGPCQSRVVYPEFMAEA